MYEIVRKQLSRTVPFAKLLGIDLNAIDAHAASASLEPAAHLNNHVGSFHAGAIFTACDTASGAALAGALLPVIMKTRFVVRDASITYLKPAKGRLVAEGRLVRPASDVLTELERDGRADIAVQVEVQAMSELDPPLDVARATFNWNLRLQRE